MRLPLAKQSASRRNNQKNMIHMPQHDCLCVLLVVVDMVVLTFDIDGEDGWTSSMQVSKSFFLCNYVGRIYNDLISFCGNNNTIAYGHIVHINQLHFHSNWDFCSHDYQVNVVTCAHSWLFEFLVQMLGTLGYTCRLHTTSIWLLWSFIIDQHKAQSVVFNDDT